MSYNQSMEEVSVETLLEYYNLVVPEIQREYVWGFNANNILVTFFNDIKEGLTAGSPANGATGKASDLLQGLVKSADEETKEVILSLLGTLKEGAGDFNIGFLYSYRPDYFVFNDRSEDIYLIDGQQRFTTLFLMLFYFSIRENRKEDFTALFRFDYRLEHIAFDYRVRTLTHNFFIDLVNRTDKIEELVDIEKKNWFLSNYEDDPTVRSIVFGFFPVLREHFKDDGPVYFDYLKRKVKFWHFKAEETSQGEELYITMNSRGQQLADNENLRAKLFEPDAVKRTGQNTLHWSARWEIWQDFFWKNRNKKDPASNADAGFNEFLRWVQIIKMTENKKIIVDDEDEDALDKKEIIKAIKWEKDCQLDIEYLSLPEIDKYFQALTYLYTDFPRLIENLRSQFTVYSNFDLLDTRWLSPASGTIPQIDLFRLLPVLFYVKRMLDFKHIPDKLNLFRFVRFFYNLRHNATVIKNAGLQVINGLRLISRLKPDDDITSILSGRAVSVTLLNAEERLKLNLLKESTERINMEDQFWMAEDMPYNKGEITFLINWSKANSSDVFYFKIFRPMLAAYVYLIDAEDGIRGDLLPTKAFDVTYNRVTWNDNWFKEPEFLSFALAWFKAKKLSLDDFLSVRRMTFIRSYKTVEDVQNESALKKQLYIYYIINQDLLKKNSNWNWTIGKNFGVYENFNGARSIFNEKHIFQHYMSVWRENYNRVVWIQRDLRLGAKKIGVLLEWAKQQ